MAVLKSPKNNRTKKLWARRVITRVKPTSNSFYSYENQVNKSNLKSFGIKYDFTLDPKKYRFIGDVHKEEKRLLGEILPSTLTKPKPERPLKTIGSKDWSEKFNFQKEFYMLANSDHFNITDKSDKLESHFSESKQFGSVKFNRPPVIKEVTGVVNRQPIIHEESEPTLWSKIESASKLARAAFSRILGF